MLADGGEGTLFTISSSTSTSWVSPARVLTSSQETVACLSEKCAVRASASGLSVSRDGAVPFEACGVMFEEAVDGEGET